LMYFFFFSSRRRHTRWPRDWSSDVCSSDLGTISLEWFFHVGGGVDLGRAVQRFDNLGKEPFEADGPAVPRQPVFVAFSGDVIDRSEERRVGKECRSRCAPYE